MILNLRPASVPALNAVIEDMSDRFSEEAQEQIIAVIGNVLGQFTPPEPPGGSQAGEAS